MRGNASPQSRAPAGNDGCSARLPASQQSGVAFLHRSAGNAVQVRGERCYSPSDVLCCAIAVDPHIGSVAISSLELSPGYSWQPGLFRSCGSLTLAVFALRRKTSDPLRSDRSPIRVRTLGDRGRMGLRPPSWPGHETGRKRGRPVGPDQRHPAAQFGI
jgi:hypothetical protein